MDRTGRFRPWAPRLTFQVRGKDGRAFAYLLGDF
jgi:hypothetical protein